MYCYLHKVYFSCQNPTFCYGKVWPLRIRMDPHWFQCGSATLPKTITWINAFNSIGWEGSDLSLNFLINPGVSGLPCPRRQSCHCTGWSDTLEPWRPRGGSPEYPVRRTDRLTSDYTVRKGWRHSRPQRRCHLPNSPCAGIIKWHPGWERECR